MASGTWFHFVVLFLVAIQSVGSSLEARELYVAPTGSETGNGEQVHPFATISQAAAVAMPGDTVIVHGGTYREWVKPPRGGESDKRRITYRAAKGETVFVKGSERITSWKQVNGAVWEVQLPNSFFGEYNPYALKVSGGWLNYGQWHHRGDVFVNGVSCREQETAEAVSDTTMSWHCAVDDTVTKIRANFDRADPNKEQVEINVRESLFMPEVSGLKYITIDGFHFMHAAANWAPPVIPLQTGAIGPRMGKCWIIENCTVSDIRCVGIILGQAPGVDYADIDAYGDHIVRNNTIRRCGQAGIAGQKGPTRSLITGNLIEQTNHRREFGGWETAAIKFHNSVDTVISNNLIRGVYHQMQGAFGIWIDFGNQGVRITRNMIYDTQAATVFLEMNHGPSLVDNNILIGHNVRSNSEATVFAHNLFVDSKYVYHPDVKRRSGYFVPHTTINNGRKTGTAQDERWYNNIFVRIGLDNVKAGPGHDSDYNVFLEGAKKSTFGDKNSLVLDDASNVTIEDDEHGAAITFSVPKAVLQQNGPVVDAKLVGVFSTVGQTIEDRYGKPISVDTDMLGVKYSKCVPGPLAIATLRAKENVVTWPMDQPIRIPKVLSILNGVLHGPTYDERKSLDLQWGPLVEFAGNSGVCQIKGQLTWANPTAPSVIIRDFQRDVIQRPINMDARLQVSDWSPAPATYDLQTQHPKSVVKADAITYRDSG
jgi:hypothetical protein